MPSEKTVKFSVMFILLAMMCGYGIAEGMTITGTPVTRVQAGQSYYFKPEVVNGITSHLQFAYINKPEWSKSYRGSGLIAGNPTQAGVWENIQIVATDGVHYAWSKPFSIVVTPAQAGSNPGGGKGSAPTAMLPAPPKAIISGTPAYTAEIGDAYSFTPTIVTTGNSKWTYAVKNKPAWAAFNPATGTLSGTPNKVASYEAILISVSNGTAGTALPAFGIEVTKPASGTANLTWSKPAQSAGESSVQLAGYVVRYGTSTNALNKQLVIASANSTSAEIQNLPKGMWYFTVAAVTSAHVIGEFSAIVGDAIK